MFFLNFLNITEIISCIYCYSMVICKSRGRTSAIPKTIEHYPPAFPTFPKELKKKKKDNPLLFFVCFVESIVIQCKYR